MLNFLAGEGLLHKSRPWTVFKPASRDIPMSQNLLSNASFETTSHGLASNWDAHFSGYTLDDRSGHSGGRALRLTSDVPIDQHAAYQEVVLNQEKPFPLYFSAWSKASDVTGQANADYSLYLDVLYTDGTNLFGQALEFAPGTHDWQLREGFIRPEKPVQSVGVNVLLRNTHAGTAWFDDLTLQEVQTDTQLFDGMLATTERPDPPLFGDTSLPLSTADGLTLELSSIGAAVTGLAIDNIPVNDADYAYASGFFVRDVLSQSELIHVGGALSRGESGIAHLADINSLDLKFSAQYTTGPDRIDIHAELQDASGRDRAITLYFALPVNAQGWTWGDDIRAERKIDGVTELSNFSLPNGLGATGHQSKYPWASLSGPAGGIALAVPLDSPRIFRLVYNPASRQFYAAFDLGISPLTAKFPKRAWADLVIYRFESEWGFRAAAQRYYDRFPDAFARRVPPEQEGIWVAFSDISEIPSIGDFGIAFHEINDLQQVSFDDAAGITSLRYLSEPWSSWFPLSDPKVNPSNHDNLVSYLRDRQKNGSGSEQRQAEATLSSGLFDDRGHYSYDIDTKPWCDGPVGCVVFTLNPDPDIGGAPYPLNKANLEWNEQARKAYDVASGLDGEYLDSLESRASTLNFRAEHFTTADVPLTFRTADRRLGMPEAFAITKYSRWLADEVHRNGRWAMGNGVRNNLPWGSDLFDIAGVEVDWMKSGSFSPDGDALMNYRRTLSYQRPYGLLMNTEFDNMSQEMVDRYFQVSLFYGIYPSMFSHDSATDPYWDNSRLYNRDRPLFRRYVPLIKRLNIAGWQPMTHAKTSDPAVYIERFGAWPNLNFTVRNTREVPVTVVITIEAQSLSLPEAPATALALVAGEQYQLSPPGSARTLPVSLGPQSTEVLQLMQAN